MSDNDKNRIKIKLPAVSYDIVKLAATLTGTSVKSFAAQAVINAALHVTAEIENRSLGSNIEADIHLTEEEAQALLELLGMPFERQQRRGKMAKTSLKVKQQRKPKYSTRAYTRCKVCGRPHSVLRKYGICRICFREMAYKGEIPGVRKASW